MTAQPIFVVPKSSFWVSQRETQETVLQEKDHFLEYAFANSALIVFQHDPNVATGKLERNGGGDFKVVSESL